MSLVAAAAPAPDDPLDRRPAGRSSSSPSPLNWQRHAARCPATSAAANPWLLLLPPSSSTTSASRCAAAAGPAPAGRRLPVQVKDAHRDPVPLLAGQLRRAGQARRRLPRLPAQAQQPGLALRKTLGTVFIERILDLFAIAVLGPRGRLLELPRQPERPAADDPGHLRPRRRRGRRADPWPCVVHAQLRPPDHRPSCRCPQRVVELYDRFEEGVFGSVGLRGLPVPRRS